MNKSPFRSDSSDRLDSPEELNSYIRVATPGVWLILGAIVLLFIGFIIFSCFAEADGVKLISYLIN